MKKTVSLLVLVFVLVMLFSCKSNNPSQPAADTATATPTASITGTASVTPTLTVSPTSTVTPTSTVISGTAIFIDAVMERAEDTDAAAYMIQVKVASTPYPNATVSVDNLDDALPPVSVPWNTSYYYLSVTGSYVVPGNQYRVSVTIDGISHTATAMAPGNITLSADGMTASWQYGEPDGDGGELYVYRTSPFAVIYSGTATAPSPFTIPSDPYTPGDGLHTIMLSQGANYYEYEGAFVGCDGGSRIMINTHKERADINK